MRIILICFHFGFRYLYIIPLFLLAGCATHAPTQLTLAHTINVPKEYRAGSEIAGMPDVSPIARYIAGYDIGWWLAVERYRKDINFNDPSPVIIGGWVEEQAGGGAGYVNARDRIEQLIRFYGKPKVSAYLQQFKVGDDD